MGSFDPDAYLATPEVEQKVETKFDPDAYLAQEDNSIPTFTESELEKKGMDAEKPVFESGKYISKEPKQFLNTSTPKHPAAVATSTADIDQGKQVVRNLFNSGEVQTADDFINNYNDKYAFAAQTPQDKQPKLFDYAKTYEVYKPLMEKLTDKIQTKPHSVDDINNLASIYDALGDHATAQSLYIHSQDTKDNVGAKWGIAGHTYMEGDVDNAKKQYQQLADEHPDFTPAKQNLAFIDAQQGNLEGATKNINKAITANPDDWWNWAMSSNINYKRGDDDAANEDEKIAKSKWLDQNINAIAEAEQSKDEKKLADAKANMTAIADFWSGKTQEKDKATQLIGWLMNPIGQSGQMMAEGIPKGVKTTIEGVEKFVPKMGMDFSPKNQAIGVLQTLGGLGEVAFTIGMGTTPAGVGINMAIQPLPQEAQEFLFAPLEVDDKKTLGNEIKKTANTLWGLALFHQMHQAGESLPQPPPPESPSFARWRDNVKSILKDVTQEEVQGAIKSYRAMPNDLTWEQQKDVLPLQIQHDKLVTEMNGVGEAFKPALQQKIKNIQQQINETINPELKKEEPTAEIPKPQPTGNKVTGWDNTTGKFYVEQGGERISEHDTRQEAEQAAFGKQEEQLNSHQQLQKDIADLEGTGEHTGEFKKTNPLHHEQIDSDISELLDYVADKKQGVFGGGLQKLDSWIWDSYRKIKKNETLSPEEKNYSFNILNEIHDAIWEYNDEFLVDAEQKKTSEELKKNENDNQDGTRVSSEVGIREKPLEAESVTGAGEEKVGDGGMVQKPQEVKEVKIIPQVEVTPDELQHLEHLKELKSLDEEGFAHQDKLDELEAKVKAGKEEGDKIAQESGYDSATHLLNSVKKNVGQDFATVQEALKSPEVQQFLKDKTEPTNEPTTTTRISEPVDKGADKGKLADSGEDKKAGKLDVEKPSESRQFAIDFVTHNLIETLGYHSKADKTMSERLDLRMDTKERNKAIADIKAGKLNTVPAKKMLDRIEQMHQDDSFQFITGTGGGARTMGVSKAAMEKTLHEVKVEREEASKIPDDDAELGGIPKDIADLIVEHNIHTFEDAENLRHFPLSSKDVDRIQQHFPREANAEPKNSVVENPQGEKNTPTGEEAPIPESELKATASRLRAKKIGKDNAYMLPDLGISKWVYNGALEFCAKQVEGGTQLGKAIQKTIQWVDEQLNGKKWDKKAFANHLADRHKVTLNGKEVTVEKDNSRETAQLINGFYSPLEQGILDAKVEKTTGKEWKKKLAGTTEADEMKWTGMNDFLDANSDKSLTKKEVQDYLKNNRVEIVEVVKGMKSSPLTAELNKKGNWSILNKNGDPIGILLIEDAKTPDEAINKYLSLFPDNVGQNETKFSQYQLEGEKSGYKEVLITMPPDEALNKEYLKGKTDKSSPVFKSSHFDEPNILAHLRMNIRTDAEGKKTLFIEEIQSDWGQKGKKEGFKKTIDERKKEILETKGLKLRESGNYYNVMFGDQMLTNIAKESWDEGVTGTIADVERALNKYRPNQDTPSAPFVTETSAWTKLALKTALQHAVKEGAERISWTTGEQQNARYDLSETVSRVEYFDGKEQLLAFDKQGNKVLDEYNIKPEKLADYIGKDAAEKILAKPYDEEFSSAVKVLEGEDLKVGGTGMKGFYGSPKEGKLGIVGQVAESMFGKGSVKETKIDASKTRNETGDVVELEFSENDDNGNPIFVSDNNGKAIGVGEDMNGRPEKYDVYLSEQKIGVVSTIEKANKLLNDKLINDTKVSTQHSIDITPEIKEAVKEGLPLFKGLSEKQKLKDSVTAAGEAIKKGAKKLGLSIDDPNIQKMGFSFDDVVDATVKLIHKGIDLHGDVKRAIDEALEKIRGTKLYKDIVGDKGADFENMVREKMQPKEETGIRHEDTAALREGAGLAEYERNPETQAGWEAEAERQIKEGYNIEALLDRTEKGTQPTPVEQKILKKYIASVADKINTDPSDANLNELKRLVDASDRIAGSAVAKSLVARQGTESIDNTLAGYFMHEIAANNDAPLTETQKSTVVKEYTEIKAAKEALEKKLADIETENNRLKAEKEVEKSVREIRRSGRKTAREKLDSEFDELSKKFSKIASGTLSSGINPELVAIVGKMAKNRVEKGITKLADVVDSIHEKVSEHLSKKDIQDILAGVHNAKKQTRSEATATLTDLKQQAKLINKYESLKNGIEPKTERVRIKKNQDLESLRKQIKEHDLSKLADYKSRVQQQITKVENDLAKGILEPEKKAPIKLDAEAIALKDKYIKVKQEREIRLMRQQYENRNAYERTRDKLTDIANVPRTIMSSMDFSAPLRQAVVSTVAHPQIAGKAAIEMFKQSVSQKRFDRWFHDVKEDPLYPRSQEAGLYIADPHDPRLSVKEEAFMNNLAEKIPLVGKMIKGSERAYVGYLNKMRWDLFHEFADKFEQEGKTFQNSPELYKGLASFVNNSTGRGKIGALESAAPILNSVFFAPRLIASRLNFLNPVYYAKLPKQVRVQALKDVGKFIGAGLTVMALAKLNGAEVESDPRSTDFGKIKSGNTRWDVWGGYQQYIRVLTQLFLGQSKSTGTGKINELNGEGVFGRTRGDVALSFARGKLAPIPSFAADILSGRTTTGEKPTLKSEAVSHLSPLLFNDVYSAMQDQGMKAIFTAGIPSMFGVGVQVYNKRPSKGQNKPQPIPSPIK